MSLDFKIEKLAGADNYDSWAFGARMLLIRERLWAEVTKPDPVAVTTATDDKSVKATTAQPSDDNQRALSTICLLLQTHVYSHVRNCTTAGQAWNNLKAAFAGSGLMSRLSVLRQLFRVSLAQSSSMDEYISSILTLTQQLAEMNHPIDDEFIAVLILNGLTEDYDPFVMALETSVTKITTDIVKAKLLNETARRSSSQAFYSRATPTKPCAICRKTNHTTDQHRTRQKPKSTQSNQSKDVQPKGANTRDRKKDQRDKGSEYKGKSNSATNVSLFTVMAAKLRTSAFILDSGSNVHTCNDRSLFLDYRTCKAKSITVANSHVVTCTGKGTVYLPGDDKNISIHDVYYVPGIYANLLSVSKLVDQGKVVTFHNEGCIITNLEGHVLVTASKKSGLYMLDTPQSSKTPKSSQTPARSNHISHDTRSATNKPKSLPQKLWHNRLAHLNHRSMQQLRDSNLATGINFPNTALEPCIPCIEGKIRRKPIPAKPGDRATELLQLVHSDISVVNYPSHSGCRYAVLFTDDFSRKTFIYIIRHKSETLRKFQEFQALVENELSKKIKCLRSDNGTEYLSHEFQAHLKQHGIRHETSVRYTPEQNGVAEAAGKVIFQKVRCMLTHANLPKAYWAEAAVYACYVKNRSPSSSLKNDTPEGVWTGKKVDISNLRTFGCLAYERLDTNRSKIASRAKRFIFTGISDTQKGGYRLIDPCHPKSFHVGRNLVFLEEKFYHRNEDKPSPSSSPDNEVSIPLPVTSPSRVTTRGGRAAQEAQQASEHSDDSDGSDAEDEADASAYEQEQRPTTPTATICEDFQEDSPASDLAEQSTQMYVPSDPNSSDSEVAECSPPKTRSKDSISNLITEDLVFASILNEGEPTTVTDALSRRDRLNWKQAMDSEMQSMQKNSVWTLTDKPEDVKIVTCRWIFKIKRNSDGSIERYKARLVARGFTQDISPNECYSPVMRYSTLKFLIALAVQQGMSLNHWDVTCAFLHGELEETVYMQQPEGYTDGTDNVLALKKAIYGLKNAGRRWYQKLTDFLLTVDFTASEVDPCVFVLRKGDSILIIGIWVDDIIVLSNDPLLEQCVRVQLETKFEIKDLGNAKHILGLNIEREGDHLKIDQSHYIHSVLEKFNMVDANKINTPMEVNLQFEKTKPGEEVQAPYRELIGSLLWIATCTRPDISFAVSKLASYSNNPSELHWKSTKRILRYLKGTQNFGLIYNKEAEANLIGYVDSDYAGDQQDRLSVTGFAFKFAGSTISWQSRKQKTVAQSTCEAEYMALAEAARECKFLVALIQSVINTNIPVFLLTDSQSAKKLAENPMVTHRSKHIDIRHHFIRNSLNEGLFKLHFVQGTENLADIFTKALPQPAHFKFVKTLLG